MIKSYDMLTMYGQFSVVVRLTCYT